jgi:formamidopyrimidine-DNA glycosylase
MPELPEVETVRRGLENAISGYTVTNIQIFDSRSIKKNLGSQQTFKRELTSAKFQSFERRGKFLWMPFDASRCLVTHLGMSGQVLVRSPGQPADKCERLRIFVQKGKKNLEVRFIDQRLFGGMYIDDLIPKGTREGVPQSAAHIAMDPLELDFEIERVVDVILGRAAGIKSLLLNQEILSGIGNIYADETLWLSKVNYLTPGHSLTKAKIRAIIQTAQLVLEKAVEQGGTSFDEQYKNVNGQSGYFSHSLNAYGQTGLPCSRCGTSIKREAWANRGSHFCPRCQRRKS